MITSSGMSAYHRLAAPCGGRHHRLAAVGAEARATFMMQRRWPRGGGRMDQAMGANRRGILFVMTGASGVGKGSLRAAAADALEGVVYSVSATTRPRRPSEREGVDYHFVARGAFEDLVRAGGLLEYAEYVGDRYGPLAAPVDAALAAGRDVLLEIELVGARQVKRARPEAVMLFVAPPSLAELERRLRGRGTDTEEKVQRRLARARDEMQALREFDYVIVNDELERAATLLRAILMAERARAQRISEAELDGFAERAAQLEPRLW
jgi:guanylate kinase